MGWDIFVLTITPFPCSILAFYIFST